MTTKTLTTIQRAVVAAELGAFVQTVQRNLVAQHNITPAIALGMAISQVVRAAGWYPQWASDVGEVSMGEDEEASRKALTTIIQHVPIPHIAAQEGQEA